MNYIEIAEILRAFIGDGWIQSNEKALYIAGNITEDRLYYDTHLSKLFSKNFLPTKPRTFKYWRVYGISCYKKYVINKAIDLGFQKGTKCLNVRIPNIFLTKNNSEINKALLRGIFDTDGSFWCERSNSKTSTKWKRTYNHHPELCITSCSHDLLLQCKIILDNLKIESKIVQKQKKGTKCNRKINDLYALRVRKISQIIKFFKVIKPRNPRHITRYAVWKKLKHLPPRTTIEQRLKILNE